MDRKRTLIPVERIERSIYLIRSQKVMLDHDLAKLYGVPTKALKQAVRRNMGRFPYDFMFELTKGEFANLRSQFVTSSLSQWGGPRYRPMAFSEQAIFEAIRQLMAPPEKPKKRIGFEVKEAKAAYGKPEKKKKARRR